MSEGGVGAQPAMPAVLHRILLTMAIGLAVVFGVLAAIGVAPVLPREDTRGADFVAYVFAAIQVVMLVVAVAVLVPRVPRRRPGQSVEVYWADTVSYTHLTLPTILRV